MTAEWLGVAGSFCGSLHGIQMHARLCTMQAVFSASAEYYDLVYGKKDYQGETDRLRGLFRDAGLSTEYLPDAFSSRGLYVARPFPTAPPNA
jgi:hypothetical protein